MSEKKQKSIRVPSPKQITRHHLIPRCRCRLRGGTHTGNIKRVQRDRHAAWHALFGIMTPFEVVTYIVTVLATPGYFTEAHVVAVWEGANSWFDLKRPSRRRESYVTTPRHVNPEDWELVFGVGTWFSAVTQVVEQWAPPNYFKRANFVVHSGESYYRFARKKRKIPCLV